MSRLLCLLAISGLAGCGDDASCGSPGSAGFGLIISSDEVNLTYGGLTAGANNDCPASDAPTGVVSLTIQGNQMSATAGLIAFCIPRPDQLADGIQLSDVKLFQASGADTTCTYAFDTGHVPTGTVKGVGVCDNGTNSAGFGLVFDGFIGLRRTCPTQSDSVSVGITGNVAVAAQAL
jgi:hypothetical protein